MRGNRALLIGTSLVVLLIAQSSLAGPGLIYQISRDSVPSGFLVGTMHSGDARVMAMLDRLAPLIEQVDVVAIEVLPDALTMLAFEAATKLPAGESLRDLVGAERFESLCPAATQRGISTTRFDRLKPWAAAVTLGMPVAEEGGKFLDLEIYLTALNRQRRAVGLETVAEQLAVFEGMPQRLQLAFLDAVIEDLDQLPELLEQLTQSYLEGDLDQLDRLSRAQHEAMPAELVHWFEDRLIAWRNARMLRRLAALLEGNSVFAAVGALHLSGETGLLAGLTRLGFEVERWPLQGSGRRLSR